MQLNYLRMILRGIGLLVGYAALTSRETPTLHLPSTERTELDGHVSEWNKACKNLNQADKKASGW